MFYHSSFCRVARFTSASPTIRTTTRLLGVASTWPVVGLLDKSVVQLYRREYATRSRVASLSTTEKKPTLRTLIYTGAFASVIRAYKATASMFSVCAVIVVPTLLAYGHDPYVTATLAGVSALMPLTLIHYMTGPYVTHMYLQIPKSQPNMKPAKLVSDTHPMDYTLILETLNLFGGRREHHVPVSQLACLSKPNKLRYLNWIRTGVSSETRVAKQSRQPTGFFVDPLAAKSTDNIFNRVYERVQQQSALSLAASVQNST
ncbi:hypothetical protein BDF22DRAFT_742558 [Syncephalis plumigaleata]|nr:hypothetical protein BDF22DRAFT_742558 [Syncephalis plumigaleata]